MTSYSKKQISKIRIVVIGPLPPPLAGTSVSFKLFCEYMQLNPDLYHLDIINSAPKDVGQRSLLNTNNLFTASRIIRLLLFRVVKADKVLLFGSHQFLVSMMPICLALAKAMRKPFYVRPFGGSLDKYYQGLSPAVRRYFHWVIGHTDGFIVETKNLNNYFNPLFGDKIHYVPGYRQIHKKDKLTSPTPGKASVLKLVYVGHIREEKGIFDLLASLQLLACDASFAIECDFFGPVYQAIAERFDCDVANCQGVNYCGVLQPEDVVPTIEQYDVFVFPSYYQGEGHPGVLIEAMMSGLPIVATEHNAIPELISHRVNGLLVSRRSPSELAAAIRLLIEDTELLATLAEQSYKMSTQYSSEQVIPAILTAIGLDQNNNTTQV